VLYNTNCNCYYY